MRILLVVPPISIGLSGEIGATLKLPDIGLAYIAASLTKEDFEIKVLDAWAEGLSLQNIKKRISSEDPDVIGLTAYTAQIQWAHQIASWAKQINENVITIVGGAHATASTI